MGSTAIAAIAGSAASMGIAGSAGRPGLHRMCTPSVVTNYNHCMF
jgi:hypothetical protein